MPVATPATSIRATDGDVLVVIGSANPRSHRQAERIDQTRGVTLLRVPGERQDDPTAVLHRLTAEASRALLSGNFGALIATGGDTMEAILDRLDVREFEVLQEFEPGFALGRSTLDTGRPLMLAMKAGGFGDDDALHRAIAMLRGAIPFQAKASS